MMKKKLLVKLKKSNASKQINAKHSNGKHGLTPNKHFPDFLTILFSKKLFDHIFSHTMINVVILLMRMSDNLTLEKGTNLIE